MRARYVMKGRREEAVAAVLDLISSYIHSYTGTDRNNNNDNKPKERIEIIYNTRGQK